MPAALRRQAGQPRPVTPGPPAPPEEQRAIVEQQLQNVLAERFGPDWFERIDQVAQDPGGRQLVAQLIGIQREAMQGGEQPAYMRGYGQGETFEGEAPAQGQLPLGAQPRVTQDPMAPQGDPAMEQGPTPQQELDLDATVPVASEPRGPAIPPNLRERRGFQQMQQEQRLADSEANPQALPQSESRSIEQEIFEAEDEVNAIEDALAQRPARDPRKKFLREALTAAKQKLADAEARWEESRLSEGPGGVEPQNRVDSPEPLAAPGERTPDGRPMGVAPVALQNPEPMSPEEAASRQQTQQKRRGAAAATPAEVATAVASSEEQVSPSTPEPEGNINAQVDAMLDPGSERDSVFVAELPDGKLPKGKWRAARAGITVVERPGVGVLLTTNPKKAQAFRRAKRDADIQKILGYSENKADALRSGKEPVVVQARTKKGVAAEQLASKAGVPAAKQAVAKLAPKGAKVIETSVAKMQQERAAPAKGAAAIAKSKEKSTPKKQPKRKAEDDDETRGRKDNDTATRADRALAQSRETREAPAPAAPADTVEKAGTRQPDRVMSKGKARESCRRR